MSSYFFIINAYFDTALILLNKNETTVLVRKTEMNKIITFNEFAMLSLITVFLKRLMKIKCTKKSDKLILLIYVHAPENFSFNLESFIRLNKTNTPSAVMDKKKLSYQTLYRISDCDKSLREINCIRTVRKKHTKVIMHTHILFSFIAFLFATKYPTTIYNPYIPPKNSTEKGERQRH